MGCTAFAPGDLAAWVAACPVGLDDDQRAVVLAALGVAPGASGRR